MLSALKQTEERSSTIVRLFNPGDEDAQIVVSTDAPIAQAFAVNFLEERQAALGVCAAETRTAGCERFCVHRCCEKAASSSRC